MSTVTFQGNPLTLEGQFPALNSKIKDFKLLANDLSPRTAKDYEGKVLVIVAVPSLDTGVCDMEVRKFNEKAASLSDDVKIVAVSLDLPFAQGRWCGAAGIKNVETLSDHYSAEFGKNYGVLIKELRLLARSIFVYDKSGNLVYSELVSEVTHEPNYDAAIDAVKKAL